MRQPVPFGKYLLLDRISVGGMAEVFKAKSYGVEGFEKIIAIKRILPTMGEDRDFIKMFIDEAKIAGQLAHANICQIFELGRIDGSHFIAMEYIWGKDLLQIQNRLRKLKQAMPIPMACFTIAKVLEGLDYAHRKRDPLGRPLEIVHRDCSPQNVLVSYEGEVKVIDFGIAKATSRNSRTMAGVLKGKFGYMSPEQVRGLPLDRRSDIFALGTMLYECLTGERLFQGETDFSTLEKVRNVDIQPPRAINPAIPEAVERVILKALAKDVDDRYQWCSEMLGDLQQYLMGQDVVFTAKTLSGWLKDVFNAEIEKERQLLEQYKRVGRDGLIAGVPAAEAKLDVVETLGEAGAPEGDATQLGGPDFEQLEAAVAAAAAVGPAPGSPAARGAAPGDDDDGDFGEEAPTEIFGEIDQQPTDRPADPVPQPIAARPSQPARPSRPPTSAPPPPPRPSMNRPAVAPPQQMAAASPNDKTINLDDANLQSPAALEAARQAYAQNFQQPPPPQSTAGPGYAGYASGPPMAAGTPGGMPTARPMAGPGSGPMSSPGLALPNAGPAKTLMGAVAPAGLGQYGGGSYPPGQLPQGQPSQPYGVPAGPPNPSQPQMLAHPSGQQMAMHPSQPPMHPSQQQMVQPHLSGYPSAQNYLAHTGHNQPQTGSMGPYGSSPAGAVEPTMAPAVEGRKKSSLARDIAIGVAIAIVVLGGFLAVKFFVLDAEEEPAAQPSKQIATLRIELPDGIEGKLFLDDGKEPFANAVKNGSELTLTAGSRKVKLVTPGGEQCEKDLSLDAAKTTTFACVLTGGSAGSAAAGSADAGSGSATGSGSAGSGSAGSGSSGSGAASVAVVAPEAGSGSAAKVEPAKVEPAKVEPKTTKIEPTKVEPTKVEPTKVEPTKVEPKTVKVEPKVTKTEPKITKTEPVKIEPKVDPKKPPKDKLPPEDNPADAAATLGQKGFLSVTSTPSAKISIDGVDTGKSTPIGKLPVAPGKHKIRFAVGGDSFTYNITIKAGETLTLHKDLQ